MYSSMPPKPTRNVLVTVVGTFYSVPQRNVSFSGSNFRELRERLAAINLPGAAKASGSFIEVLVDDRFVCLLDSDKLPEGDLQVNVYSLKACEGMETEINTSRSRMRDYLRENSALGHGPTHGPPRHPHDGPPPPHPWHGAPPMGPPQVEGPPHHGHGPDHHHGPPSPHHHGHGKGRRSDKECGRHRRHHHSSRSRSPSPSHRHGGHRHRHRHGRRSKSRSSSSAHSHSPRRGGVDVHIHHHGPRFHGGRGMHHHHPGMHPHMPQHGPSNGGHPGEVDVTLAAQGGGEQRGEAGDWQEVSGTGAAAKALGNLAIWTSPSQP